MNGPAVFKENIHSSRLIEVNGTLNSFPCNYGIQIEGERCLKT